MTNSTNWPNPEQPYVPLFPERSGWHLLVSYSRPPAGIAPYGVPQLLWWSAQKAAWSIMPTGRIEDLARAEEKSSLSYVGPVLTPTQISEMLAAERERCAMVCDKLADDFLPCHSAEYAWEIRNLGAAP